jgi:pyruvate/2-oxoglutarate/acetoin dehydrogenase E1 component
MSYGEFNSPVLIRATIGSMTPIYPGPQHTQNFTDAFKNLLCMKVYSPKTSSEIINVYNSLKDFSKPALIIEERDNYNKKF